MFDVATGTATSQMAQNMVIVKVKGNLTINEGVTVGPYYNTRYGGPKGFTLYVTGKLTNNGTIDNSHGAYATGEDVYLWKNSQTDNYEYIPASGAAGAAAGATRNGRAGFAGTGRQTGGGGTSGNGWGGNVAAGGIGTSYSGGPGGGFDTAGSSNGGAGGSSKSASYAAGGAGNPGGAGSDYAGTTGANGTGGLLVIYSNEYENNGKISANGIKTNYGDWGPGGSSGGGSVNIFTNQSTNVNSLKVVINEKYNEILGNVTSAGGPSYSAKQTSGAGGNGTVNIGEIVDGQYYDLKDIIQRDMDEYANYITISGDSILRILSDNKDLEAGYYVFRVPKDDVNYDYRVHLYSYDGDTTFNENMMFGDKGDISRTVASTPTSNEYRTYAQNMVIVKVNGNLTINDGVKVGPYYTEYGGPKGFTLYVTGKLTNNGTIDNSHGAYAEGEDVYLWKNSITNDYEYIPAVGGAGGAGSGCCGDRNGNAGVSGSTVEKRALGGGGSGSTRYYSSAIGGSASSYSGGTGSASGPSYKGDPYSIGNPSNDGGTGGYDQNPSSYHDMTGGTGNPGGRGSNNWTRKDGNNGTAGLLVVYSNEFENNGLLSSNGTTGAQKGGGYHVGGASGGGSINVFTNHPTNINELGTIINEKYNEIRGNMIASGGASAGSSTRGGAGGAGTVNIGEIRDGQYYDLKDIIQQDIDNFVKSNESLLLYINNKNYSSTGEYNENLEINGELYPIHVYNYQGNQEWTTSNVPNNGVFGSDSDIGTSNTDASRMVIVKVNGDLSIGSGVTVGPYYTNYGGPKGFMLYVTGTLTNNGTIDNSHGAKATGQNVYLWKNVDESYEYVPATGAAGGKGVKNGSGLSGNPGLNRATGGGGSGFARSTASLSGNGGTGTSYSGGTGSGSANNQNGGIITSSNAGSSTGGAGSSGTSDATGISGVKVGGVGNPTPASSLSASSGWFVVNNAPENGTGGLLIVYANNIINNTNSKITANGHNSGRITDKQLNTIYAGGSSGGGSINIFFKGNYTAPTTINANGGSMAPGGAGGNGSITVGSIATGTFVQNNATTSVSNENTTNNTDSTDSGTKSLSPKSIKPQVANPTIGIDTEGYAEAKTIDISYPDGYTKEYSLDLGKTWSKYTSSITVNKATTIIARAVDGEGKVVSASTITIEEIDTETPTIELDMKDAISVGDDITLPTGYTSTKSGVEYECKIGEEVITTTKDLSAGEYDITCTITNKVGKSSNVTKHIVVNNVESVTIENKEETKEEDTKETEEGE